MSGNGQPNPPHHEAESGRIRELYNRVMYRCWYQTRPYYAITNRCWRCLLNPYHN